MMIIGAMLVVFAVIFLAVVIVHVALTDGSLLRTQEPEDLELSERVRREGQNVEGL